MPKTLPPSKGWVLYDDNGIPWWHMKHDCIVGLEFWVDEQTKVPRIYSTPGWPEQKAAEEQKAFQKVLDEQKAKEEQAALDEQKAKDSRKGQADDVLSVHSAEPEVSKSPMSRSPSRSVSKKRRSPSRSLPAEPEESKSPMPRSPSRQRRKKKHKGKGSHKFMAQSIEGNTT